MITIGNDLQYFITAMLTGAEQVTILVGSIVFNK